MKNPCKMGSIRSVQSILQAWLPCRTAGLRFTIWKVPACKIESVRSIWSTRTILQTWLSCRTAGLHFTFWNVLVKWSRFDQLDQYKLFYKHGSSTIQLYSVSPFEKSQKSGVGLIKLIKSEILHKLIYHSLGFIY